MLISQQLKKNTLAILILLINSYYLRRRLASGEGIVSFGVRLSRCVCVRRISLGGEGNALYPVLSSYYYYYFFNTLGSKDPKG